MRYLRKIMHIPGLGYVLRVIVKIIKLPKELDQIHENEKNFQNSLDDVESRIRKIESQIYELQHQVEIQKRELDIASNRIFGLEQSLHDELADIKNNKFERDYIQLLSDNKKLEQLNLQLSTHPVVWGDKAKLHISERAAVNACFFNTNSGHIYIGDYTFSGSNVSILAGSHDMKLSGLLRRDVEYKEGYDIHIGEGVWLSSNCVILGPCTIEDNAVISAGSVVKPGTVVKESMLYGGVPAKPIRKIDHVKELDEKQDYLREVLERENNVLFYSGWTEKKMIDLNGIILEGHYLLGGNAIIYTNKADLELYLWKSEATEIIIEVEEQIEKIMVDSNLELKSITLKKQSINKVNIRGQAGIFVSYVNRRI